MNAVSDFQKIIERKLVVVEAKSASPNQRARDGVYATIGSEIKCDQEIFDSYSYEGWKEIHRDLLILCAAVEYADRRWSRGTRQWARSIHLTVPVVELAIWLDANVQQNLRDTLRHLTGDDWQFSFVKSTNVVPAAARQRPLFPKEHKEFAIAYSEGLDSLCVSGLYNENNEAVCVRVAKHKQRRRRDERPFDRLPFDVSVKPSAEDSVRSRGFKFAAVTAIAAHISKVSRIIVPESGQGALGPVLLPLRNIYPDYRNHPTFFRRMERFIKALLHADIRYEQPRLWKTKGQTIKAYLDRPGVQAQQIVNTRSCWQQRANVRVDGKLRQCGVCAACLLRRMSLHAAGISESSDAYTIADLGAENFSDALAKHAGFKVTATLRDYGYMGARHLQQLGDFGAETDAVIKPYAFELAEALGMPMDDVQSRLREMLNQHSEEWRAFVDAQGDDSFLRLWIKGGRHG